MPLEKREKGLRDYWFLALFLLSLILLTLMALRWGSVEKQELPAAAIPGSAPPTGRDVDVFAGLSQSKAETGKPVRFWLTIRNRTAKPITNVSLESSGLGGFQITASCWKPQSGASSCIPASAAPGSTSVPLASPAYDSLVSSLAPCQTLSVWGDLSANVRQEKQTLFVTLRWLSHEQHPSQLVVPLGVLEARDESDRTKERWAIVVAFYKDLGMPLLLVLLAYLVKKWEENREHKRQKAESDRQQLLQTWNQMLPISHKDATKYYMPLASALRSSRDSFLKCQGHVRNSVFALPASDALVKEALYYFLLALRRFRSISRDRGGFYFKDRTGERVSSLCVDALFDLYLRGSPTLGQYTSSALSEIQPFETYGSFISILDASLAAPLPRSSAQEAFFEVHSRFYSWLSTAEFGRMIPLLKAFLRILDFQMNQPYEYWYPREQKELLRIEQDEKDTLTGLAAEAARTNDQYHGLPDELKEYFKRSGEAG